MIDLGALQGHVVLDGVEKATSQVKGIVEELGRGGRQLSDFEKGLNTISESAEKLGKDLTTKVTAPIVALGGASFKLAADFQETLSKTDAVFKESSEGIKEWAKDSIQSMGMAQATALNMTSTFGAMGSSIGLMKEQNDNYAKSLTQLAADLSSFHNMSLDQVKTALTGIYTGETESIKQLGIAMTVTNLEAFALTQGIEKQWKEMTQAEQVSLRYEYVMNATKDAQGDFARTSDSAANQLKILVESLKELGTTFGDEIIPYITPVVAQLNDLIQKFGELDEETKQQIVQFGLLAAAAGPTVLAVGKVIGVVNGLLGACKSLSLFLSANPYAIGIAALGVLVAGATKLVVDYLTYADKVEEKAEQTARKIEMLKKGIFDTEGAEEEIETLEILILQYDRVAEKVESCRNEETRLENTLRDLNKQREEGKITQDEYNQKYYDTMKALEKVQYETGEYHYSLDELGKKLNDTAGGVDLAREYVEEYANTLSKTVVPALTQQQNELIKTANTYAKTGETVIFNSSQQAKAEIDNIYAVIQALEAKQKAIIAEARASGYEEELRQAEAAHTAIRVQIEALEEYKQSVETNYNELLQIETTHHEESLTNTKSYEAEKQRAIREALQQQEQDLRDHYQKLNEKAEIHYNAEMERIEGVYSEQRKALQQKYEGESGLITEINNQLRQIEMEEDAARHQEKLSRLESNMRQANNAVLSANTTNQQEVQRAIEKQQQAQEALQNYHNERAREVNKFQLESIREMQQSEYNRQLNDLKNKEKEEIESAKNTKDETIKSNKEKLKTEIEDLKNSNNQKLTENKQHNDKQIQELTNYTLKDESIRKQSAEKVKQIMEDQNKVLEDSMKKMADLGAKYAQQFVESYTKNLQKVVSESANILSQLEQQAQKASSLINQMNSSSGRTNNTFYYGSHANGIDYVPFDGYKTELHQGEKVIKAGESVSDNNELLQELIGIKEYIKRLPRELLSNERMGTV